MTERSLSRLRQRQTPRVLPAQMRRRVLNENAPPGSFPDNDLPTVLMQERYSCSYLITPADPLSRSRSSSPRMIRHETRVGQKASRKESHRRKKYLNVDRQLDPSTVQATCNQPYPSPHRDQYQRA